MRTENVAVGLTNPYNRFVFVLSSLFFIDSFSVASSSSYLIFNSTFVITFAYFRIDPSLSLPERLQRTMETIGWSIFLTTLTTVVAFLIGVFSSSLGGVRWMCVRPVWDSV